MTCPLLRTATLLAALCAALPATAADLPGETSRGAREVAIFRNNAAGVVLIAAGDSLGSGVLLDRDKKLVLTNWHVVEGQQDIRVIFKPGTGTDVSESASYEAGVVRIDETADLALLALSQVPAGVTELRLGSISDLPVGSDVHAIGHPTGELWSYTRGIVSQVRPHYGWNSGDGHPHQATVIQTQTPINPGNSGGPLLDDSGAVIGINSFTRSDAQGLNYAVSVDDIRSFLARDSDRRSAAPAEAPPQKPAPEPKGGKGRGPNKLSTTQ